MNFEGRVCGAGCGECLVDGDVMCVHVDKIRVAAMNLAGHVRMLISGPLAFATALRTMQRVVQYLGGKSGEQTCEEKLRLTRCEHFRDTLALGCALPEGMRRAVA